MSKTLLLTSSKDVNQIKKIRKNENGEVIIIALNYAAQKGLQKESIPFNTLEKYVTDKDYEENIKETIKWIKSWPNMKNIDKKSFKEFVVYQNFSLWWKIEVPLFFEFKLSDITWEIKKIKNAINIENPQKIIIVGNKKLYKEIVVAIGNLKKIQTISIEPAITLNNVRYFIQFLKPHFIGYMALARDFVRKYLVKIINSILKLKKKEWRHEKNKIIIVSRRRGWQVRLNLKSGKKRKADIYFDSLIGELLKNNENDILLIHLDNSKTLGLKILLEKLLSTNLKCIPIEAYFSIRAKKKGKFLSHIWKYLKNNEVFKNSLIFDEVPIWNQMKDILYLFFTLRFIRLIQHIEGIKQMIKLEKPDIIVMTNDVEQGFSLVGKKENVPTLSIQHGVIGPPVINFVNAEGGPTDVVNPLWRPIVDKLAVFGDYYKDIFVNYGSYSPDKVVVTGQPKNDYLARADKIFDKNKLCNKLGIKPNEKIVVWITQTHGLTLDENRKSILCVYNTIKLLENIQLIIKLHPGEDQKAPLYKENKLIKPIIIAAKDADTNELLYACDVIITKNSTTAIEAMILNKPVIILNLSKMPDAVPYAGSGVAVAVYKEEDLLPTLEKVLYNSQFREKLEKNRKKFVYEHAYIQDGKASERVADLIMEMIEESRRKKELRNEGVKDDYKY
jgi:UDP-N-acetylglucosamine 2-epimerase